MKRIVTGGDDVERSMHALLPTQRDIILYEAAREGSTRYSAGSVLWIREPIDIERWSAVLQGVLARTESARLHVTFAGGTPRQFVDERRPIEVAYRDLREKGDVDAAIASFIERPYAVPGGSMIRLGLFQCDGAVATVVACSHAVIDGDSLYLIARDAVAAYRGEPAGSNGSFLAHVDDVSRRFDGADTIAYWTSRGSDLATLSFAAAPGRPAGETLRLDAESSDAIVRAAAAAGVSLAAFFRGVVALLADTYSYGDAPVLFREAFSGRNAGTRDVVGPLFHMVPVVVDRSDMAPGVPAQAFLASMQSYRRRLQGRQYISMLAQRQALRTAGIQLWYSYHSFDAADIGPPSASFAIVQSVSADELRIVVSQVGGRINILVHHAAEGIDAGRVARHVAQLARSLARATVLGDTAALSERELHQVLVEWNATAAVAAPERCVHELFQAQAAKNPTAVAVVFDGAQLTYGELNARANRVARYLRGMGVGPDTRVAVCVERSLDLVVGLLAVLKAGGAYVPLDPSYPLDRLKFMLADSAPVAVLTHAQVAGEVRELLAGGGVAVVDLQRDALRWSSEAAENLERDGLALAHLAYVIYTSGTTGRPKGVMVTHANVSRLFAATQGWFGFGERDVWTLFHSFAFDFSVWEMWGALVYGGRLVVVAQSTARSPVDFYELVCAQGVTVLNQTPSAFRQLVAAQGDDGAAHRLRAVIFGGEALDAGMLAPWLGRGVNRGVRLVNMYGITETTVHVTYEAIEPETLSASGSIIGRRLGDLRVYVLDTALRPVPVGVAGELYVGGAGVARGYLNRPELTAQRFMASPFVAGDRLYKTGDVARYVHDGRLEYLGRNDMQVKLRGFRIELGEIEARLGECAGIRDAVVLAREDVPGDKRLTAYYTSRDGEEISAETLRSHLLEALPEYMVPAAYVRLESLPLTSNGKLDRAALPAPDGSSYAVRAYEPPVGAVEEAIARIWSELLQVERVGRYDNFFELGGHSLLAVRVLSAMRAVGLHTDVQSFYKASSLHDIGALTKELTEIRI